MVSNFAEAALLDTTLVDKYIKSIGPPRNETVLYNSAAVPIIATVARKDNEQDQETQEVDNVEEITTVEYNNEAPKLKRAAGGQRFRLTRRAQH